MKIPSDQGPIAIHGSQEAARKAKGNWIDSKAIHNIDGAEACEQYKYRREKAASADQPKPMLLCDDIAEQKMLLGSQLSEEQEKTLIRFLFNNKDVFAWSTNDLCGVNKDVIEHSLNVDPSFRPRKQRLRKMSDDKAEDAWNEVKRLLSAGVIREVKYPEWLANTTKDRFSGRRSSFVRAHEFTRLLFRLPSNLDEERRRAKNQLHHPQWYILLPSDA
jgi:hypothetical protein